MGKTAEEWLKQADYDIETADYMFSSGRYFYAVFMCHMALEKALKGLYVERLKETVPKKHNLVYFLNKIGIVPPEHIGRFLVRLNEASVVTRYPESLDKLAHQYTDVVVREILDSGKEALQWIRQQF
ncbi:HEPN domain-containing protein [Candidatus Sumerlaeota bacterium]|nr:HEPN domain-containing protein [Candidatus Sumerlaeota bacterium]